MKSKALLPIGILLVIFGALYVYLSSSKNTPLVPASNQIATGEAVSLEKYITSGKVPPYKSGVKRVLFFYANWCPSCIPADKDISDNVNSIPENLQIVRINYNDDQTDKNEKELAAKYGITYQHTFVIIDENDQEVSKWNGGGLDGILKLTR